MSGRVVRGGCKPRTVPKNGGKGWRIDNASGFVTTAQDYTDDVRQGDVAVKRADFTPGFGTHHPQDVVNLPALDDPVPVENAEPGDNRCLTAAEMNISDQEIKLSIQENRPPRMGY